MVEIVDGLKAKLVEIDTQLDLLRRQIGDCEEQKDAFVKVITVYDPEFTLASAAPRKPRSAQRGTASSRVTKLLKGKNNRHVGLDILRRSDRPTSSSEIASAARQSTWEQRQSGWERRQERHEGRAQPERSDVLVGLPQCQDAHALAVLVSLLAAVLAFFLLVCLAENTADILAVDLDQSLKCDGTTTKANSFTKLLQQDVGRLVLDVELAAQMERRHSLGGRDLFPDRHDDLLERQLPVREHRSRCHRKLGSAFRFRASEAATADIVRLQTSATRAIGPAAVVWPAEVDEEAVGVVLGE